MWGVRCCDQNNLKHHNSNQTLLVEKSDWHDMKFRFLKQMLILGTKKGFEKFKFYYNHMVLYLCLLITDIFVISCKECSLISSDPELFFSGLRVFSSVSRWLELPTTFVLNDLVSFSCFCNLLMSFWIFSSFPPCSLWKAVFFQTEMTCSIYFSSISDLVRDLDLLRLRLRRNMMICIGVFHGMAPMTRAIAELVEKS